MPDPAHGGGYAVASPTPTRPRPGGRPSRPAGTPSTPPWPRPAPSTVVYPHMCAVGGDIMALVHDGEAHAVNGSGRAPAAAPAGGGCPSGACTRSPSPARSRPGTMMAERWGSLPLPRPRIDVAAELAEAGVPVARSLARRPGRRGRPGRGRCRHARRVRAGRAGPAEGDTLVQPALAATLRRLAENGADELYRGETGARLVAGLAALGCLLTTADLEAHRTDVEPALRHTVGDDSSSTRWARTRRGSACPRSWRPSRTWASRIRSGARRRCSRASSASRPATATPPGRPGRDDPAGRGAALARRTSPSLASGRRPRPRGPR